MSSGRGPVLCIVAVSLLAGCFGLDVGCYEQGPWEGRWTEDGLFPRAPPEGMVGGFNVTHYLPSGGLPFHHPGYDVRWGATNYSLALIRYNPPVRAGAPDPEAVLDLSPVLLVQGLFAAHYADVVVRDSFLRLVQNVSRARTVEVQDWADTFVASKEPSPAREEEPDFNAFSARIDGPFRIEERFAELAGNETDRPPATSLTDAEGGLWGFEFAFAFARADKVSAVESVRLEVNAIDLVAFTWSGPQSRPAPEFVANKVDETFRALGLAPPQNRPGMVTGQRVCED